MIPSNAFMMATGKPLFKSQYAFVPADQGNGLVYRRYNGSTLSFGQSLSEATPGEFPTKVSFGINGNVLLTGNNTKLIGYRVESDGLVRLSAVQNFPVDSNLKQIISYNSNLDKIGIYYVLYSVDFEHRIARVFLHPNDGITYFSNIITIPSDTITHFGYADNLSNILYVCYGEKTYLYSGLSGALIQQIQATTDPRAVRVGVTGNGNYITTYNPSAVGWVVGKDSGGAYVNLQQLPTDAGPGEVWNHFLPSKNSSQMIALTTRSIRRLTFNPDGSIINNRDSYLEAVTGMTYGEGYIYPGSKNFLSVLGRETVTNELRVATYSYNFSQGFYNSLRSSEFEVGFDIIDSSAEISNF